MRRPSCGITFFDLWAIDSTSGPCITSVNMYRASGRAFLKTVGHLFLPCRGYKHGYSVVVAFKPRQRDTTVLKPVLLWQNKQSLGEGHGFYGGYPTPGGRLEQPRHTPGQSPPTPTRNSCSLVIDTRHRQNLHPMVRNNGSSFGRTTLTPRDPRKKTGSFFGGDIGHYNGRRLEKPKALLGHVRINEIVLQTLFPWLLAHFSIRKDVARQQKVVRFFFLWPPSEDHTFLESTRRQLFGSDRNQWIQSSADQLGLLQIMHDFCGWSDGNCNQCLFRECAQMVYLQQGWILPGKNQGCASE